MNKANSIINIFLLAGDKFMLEWSGYFFKEMVNILDIQPEHFLINDFEGYKNGSTILNVCCEENSVPHVVFNNTECVSRKSGVFSYLIF